MNIRGRSVGGRNIAAKLNSYLLHNPKNDKAIFLGAHGTSFPNDLQKSLDQMVLMAELTKSQKPLYFSALSPDLDNDKKLTKDDWQRMVEIQAEEHGFDTWAMVGHHKVGKDGQLRIHLHVVYQRTDVENGVVHSDEFNRKTDARVRERIEIEFGHQRTFQRWTLEEKREIERQQAIEAEQQRQAEKMTEFVLNSMEVEDKQPEPEPEIEDRFTRMRRIYELQKQHNQDQEHSI